MCEDDHQLSAVEDVECEERQLDTFIMHADDVRLFYVIIVWNW